MSTSPQVLLRLPEQTNMSTSPQVLLGLPEQTATSQPPPVKHHGLSLFRRQLFALLTKNFFISLRNKRSTFLQLASSIFFVFLIFCVDRAVETRRRTTSGFRNLEDPKAKPVGPIPACETGYYIKTPCYDFIWSGKNIERASSIVENIRKNNPGRPIPKTKVLEFESVQEVNQWLMKNRMQTTGAIHFQEQSSTVLAYGIQTNSTVKNERGVFEDPTFTFQIPLQLAVEREIARSVAGGKKHDHS